MVNGKDSQLEASQFGSWYCVITKVLKAIFFWTGLYTDFINGRRAEKNWY